MLDADDELGDVAIERLVEKAVAYKAEIVAAEWILIDEKARQKSYTPQFGGQSFPLISEGQKANFIGRTYFSVAKLYSVEFLSRYKIAYGSGYIYEDMEFLVGAILYAKKISVIGQPLYFVHINESSSTRANHDSDWHSLSFQSAVRATVSKHVDALEKYKKSYTRYIMDRVFLYAGAQGRVPPRLRYEFARGVFSDLVTLYPNGIRKSDAKFAYRMILRTFKMNNRLGVMYFYAYKFLEDSRRVKGAYISVEKRLKALSGSVDRWARKKFPARYHAALQKEKRRAKEQADKMPFEDNAVLIHGFDGKFKGNTKYVAQALIDAGLTVVIPLALHHDDVPHGATMVTPWSPAHHAWLRKARFHLLETWSHPNIGKRPEAVWIQMWHGTPFKKLLFDSPERDVMQKSPSHKRAKMRDVAKWDYAVAQNDFCAERLVSSFSISSKNVRTFGYPRTDVFASSRRDEFARAIRKKYKVPEGKKVLLYATTWRDYNQYSNVKDNSYLFDWSLVPEVSEEYHVLYSGHPFGKDKAPKNMIVTHNDDFQHLLLAADALITDYSSAAFDYLMLERPFCFFVKDLEKFERSRGVYPEVLEDFAPFVARDEIEAILVLSNGYDAAAIKNVERYIDGPAGFASAALADFICNVRNEIQEEAHQKPFLHLVHSNDTHDDDTEDAVANG